MSNYLRKLLIKLCTQRSNNIKNNNKNLFQNKIHNNNQSKLTMYQFLMSSTTKMTIHTCCMTRNINNNLLIMKIMSINMLIRTCKIKEKCLKKVMSQNCLSLKLYQKISFLPINSKKTNYLRKITINTDICIKPIFSRSQSNFIKVFSKSKITTLKLQ